MISSPKAAPSPIVLRQDNADLRLSQTAIETGLLSGAEAEEFSEKKATFEKAQTWVRKTRHEGLSLDHWFRRDENSWQKLPDEIQKMFPVELWPIIETDFRHEGHIQRQQAQIDRMAKSEERKIPASIDFMAINGLKKEAQHRFSDIKPLTLGQASRISGITPADIGILSIYLEKHLNQKSS